MGLTKRELSVVDETHQDQYTVWVREDGSGFWRIEIHVDETGRMYELDTTRGGAKAWRHLEDAVTFTQENCPRARQVFLESSGWTFEKTDAAKARKR